MIVNGLPHLEILSEDAVQTIDRGWRRLVSEIGVQFLDPRALEAFRAAGQRVEEDVVLFDPAFIDEQVALAPPVFTLHARNPSRDLVIGGANAACCPVQGPPFVRRGVERRDATLADFSNFCRLSQTLDEIDTAGGAPCEPGDRPLDSRHLDMQLELLTATDKPYMGSQVSEVAARDSVALARIAVGDAVDAHPYLYTVINVNSPLRYDERMLGALFVYAEAGQAVVVTPFLLMGAMAPVTIPAALAQQLAEALAGIALVQLIRPGCPVVLGSFLSNTDMQNGSPGFGGPESFLGLLCSGQLARHYGLPWRSGGGALTSSPLPDAQAAYEGMNTMLPALLGGANLVLHVAGWLEGGLVADYEKFMLDIEMLRVLKEELRPLDVDDASLAYDAHAEVRHGGHFLGAVHTLERFRHCFYRPLVSTTANFERWTRDGALDARARASLLVDEVLARYEPPPLDDAVRAELREYVDRRRTELGD
ncbi:MAG TPA: trimethylamine methyltransferase family protein [Gaiellaceae bacterium]|nr:trimethylamine methyltransferase family protein [Gaiellaceae bacterium]